MTELEWLEPTQNVAQYQFLLDKGSVRKLQLFLCACCRHAYSLLSDATCRRVSKEAKRRITDPELSSLLEQDLWDVCHRSIELAEKIADQLSFDDPFEAASDARGYSKHFEYLAAGATGDEDEDDAAIKLGGDAADAVESALLNDPRGIESCVRIVATAGAFDSIGYYAGAHGDSDESVRPNNAHILFRRAERAVQWKLLKEVFGDEDTGAPWSRWQSNTVIELARSIYDHRSFEQMGSLGVALQDAGCENSTIMDHCWSDGPHVRGCWVLDGVLGNS